MRLTHTLELPAPVDRTFDVFSRLDLLAPCFPGASVWGRDGDVYHGAVKIKFGPFPLVFEGTARVVRVDVAERRVVVKANARDRRGAAAGAATVTATFRPIGTTTGSDRTVVEVGTELDLTGRPAQLGAGAITSVSDRLKDQFAGCIAAKLAAGRAVDAGRRRPAVEGDSKSAAGGRGTTASAAPARRACDPTSPTLPPSEPRGGTPSAGAARRGPDLVALGGRHGRRRPALVLVAALAARPLRPGRCPLGRGTRRTSASCCTGPGVGCSPCARTDVDVRTRPGRSDRRPRRARPRTGCLGDHRAP